MQADEYFGKFFNDYDDKNRIPYQIELYKKLENDKSKKSNLLKEKNFGIPTTIFLLLMKDAMEIIKSECDKIRLKFKEIEQLNTQKMLSRFSINYKDPSFYTAVAGLDWDYNQTAYIEPSDALISGSTIAFTMQILVPTPNVTQKLSDLFESSNKNITIYNTVIGVKPVKKEKIPLIELYKNLVLYIEFSYALVERLKYEIEIFIQEYNKSLTMPTIPGSFNKFCSKRTDFTHKGHINVNIDHASSKVIIGKKKEVLDNLLLQSFNDLCDWIDNFYKLLYDNIGN